MCSLPPQQGCNWVVYDDQRQFYEYDSGDVSYHGYDYRSDDLPVGCHFEDDSDNLRSLAPAPVLSTAAHGPAAVSQPFGPAHAPAPGPHQGLCSQHAGTLDNSAFTKNGTLDDHTECRSLVCHPVAVKTHEQTQVYRTALSGGIIAAIALASVGVAAILIWGITAMLLGCTHKDPWNSRQFATAARLLTSSSLQM